MSFVRANTRSRAPNAADLEAALEAEMRNPSTDAAHQPIIHGEPAAPAPITRLFVIWDEWGTLPQIERSEIILNAYTAALGQADALRIAVAMGLTSSEATRMGIG